LKLGAAHAEGNVGLLLAWLGLDGKSKNESVPLWNGVSEKAKWGSLLVCLGISFLTFAITRWLFNDYTEVLGFVPWISGAGVLLISSLLVERSLTRASLTSRTPTDDKLQFAFVP